MSVCVPCFESPLIPACLTDLVIGTITDFNEPVYIYILDVTTGRLNRFEETSNGAGLVTLTGLDTEPDFMPNHAYELWITKQSADNIEVKEAITILNVAETQTCIAIKFNYVQPDVTFTTITIT